MNPVVVRNIKIGEGIPKICVPIIGKTEEEILNAAQEIICSSADLVEWRADWFEAVFEIEAVKKVACKMREVLGEIPLLFTFRTKAEGGEKEIAFEKYSKLLKEVAETGNVDLVDVEAFFGEAVPKLISDLQDRGVKVVGSNHDFYKTPSKEEIIKRLCYMQEIGADISKIAVMPQTKKDVLTLLSATEEMTSQHAYRPIVTMSMAGLGVVSRVSGEVFGSAITFGAMQKASAPGQVNVEELRKMLEILHQNQRP